MKKIFAAAMIMIFIFSSLSISASETDEWWNDDFNYRVKIVPQNSTDPGMVDIDLGLLIDELGLHPFDPDWGFDESVDPESFRLVSVGQNQESHEFKWSPEDYYLVDDFESDDVSWNLSSEMDTVYRDGDDGSSLMFYKNTESGVKMYTSVPSDSFKDMEYLMFYAKGSFKIALRDPAKGKYMVEEELLLPEFQLVVLPLSFVNFRNNVDFYLELIPLDFVTTSIIDDIRFIDDTISMEFAPVDGDLYLYFNSYVTGLDSDPLSMSDISGDPEEASLGDVEGFRVLFDEVPASVSGQYLISATVLDNRDDIEWVRYRIDYPSWVDIDSTEYGVWGEMSPDGGRWMAEWDTVSTTTDGHHTLTVYAKDTSGDIAFQIAAVEINNIVDNVNLSPGTDNFRFAVVGDTQAESGTDNNPMVSTYIMQSIAKNEDVDFIIQVGDLCYAGYGYEFVQVRNQITSFAEVPFYPVVGNHDAAAREGIDNFEFHFGHVIYSFDYGNSHFIFLCTELEGEKGLITGDQLEWLDGELSQNADMEHIFIIAHQPLYPIFHGIGNQEEVHGVIESYDNVTAIFQGHEHTYFHEVVNGMHNFISGGATWLDPQYPVENTFNHYFVMSVDGPEYEWNVIETSNFYLEEPKSGYSTNESFVEISGHTQPYVSVDVNGIAASSNVRGEFTAEVPLEYGANTITAMTNELPDGNEHSMSITVYREVPLELDCPTAISGGEALDVNVSTSEGPAEGVMVHILDVTKATDQDGNVSFDSYPSGNFKVSASGPGYYGTFTMVDGDAAAEGESDGGLGIDPALVVIVVIALGAIISLFRRK